MVKRFVSKERRGNHKKKPEKEISYGVMENGENV